jgi:general secretion pathway protein F
LAIFSYKGFDTRGKAVVGVKDADNLRALRGVLKREGVLITEAKEGVVRLANGASSSLANFTPAALYQAYKDRDTTDRLQVSVVTRQLGTLLKAGVPLSESLGALVEQIDIPAFKRTLSDVRTQVNEGASLADALSRHPKTFEDL